MLDKINEIKKLIDSDSNIAEEIIKYCEKIIVKSKILNMKLYVLEKIDNTYDINTIKIYLDKITELNYKVYNNNKDCYHDIQIHISFKINEVLIDFKCKKEEGLDNNFIININEQTIINDNIWHDYCMIKKDNDNYKFNLNHYYNLDFLSNICAE